SDAPPLDAIFVNAPSRGSPGRADGEMTCEVGGNAWGGGLLTRRDRRMSPTFSKIRVLSGATKVDVEAQSYEVILGTPPQAQEVPVQELRCLEPGIVQISLDPRPGLEEPPPVRTLNVVAAGSLRRQPTK